MAWDTKAWYWNTVPASKHLATTVRSWWCLYMSTFRRRVHLLTCGLHYKSLYKQLLEVYLSVYFCVSKGQHILVIVVQGYRFHRHHVKKKSQSYKYTLGHWQWGFRNIVHLIITDCFVLTLSVGFLCCLIVMS